LQPFDPAFSNFDQHLASTTLDSTTLVLMATHGCCFCDQPPADALQALARSGGGAAKVGAEDRPPAGPASPQKKQRTPTKPVRTCLVSCTC